MAGKVIANFWLDKVYNKQEGDAHRKGDYHIHDLDILGPYCCGHDLQKLLDEGFNGVQGRVGSNAPKHFREALYQMANYIGILQAEWAGAQAFSSFDTYLAPYVFFDMIIEHMSEDEIKKAIRNFVYNLNVPARWGQSPFSNVTIDWTVPEVLANNMPTRNGENYFISALKDKIAKDETFKQTNEYKLFIDSLRERLGTNCDDSLDDETVLMFVTYSLFQKEMDIINKCFYEVLNEGDSTGQPFTFPIPTINITEEFDWDSKNSDILFENAAKYGSSYFQNFIGSQFMRDENGELVRDPNAYSPKDVRSMCCRLALDLKELRNKGGGLFGSDAQTGSVGVVTINCARLGYLHKNDKKSMYKALDSLLNKAKSTLEKKRAVCDELYDRGLFPYTKRYLDKKFTTFFSTIGVNGMNEMVRNFTNDEHDITTDYGYELVKDMMIHIRDKIKCFQEETGNLYNLEATPAEGTTYRFAREDLKHYPEIIQAGTKDNPYYTNSSQLPVGYSSDCFDVLDKQDELQKMYTGGTVLHLYMSERLSSPEACKQLVKKALSNYRLPYISVSPVFSICPKHGYLKGEHKYCPLCDDEIVAKHS